MLNKKFLLNTLKYIVFFGAGVILFIWVYKGQDFSSFWKDLSRFKYGWIAASFLVFLLSHLFRALRWRMLIESIGYKPRLVNTFLAILVMYLANSVVTRMGEVTRCGILKKYDDVPFTSQLGTVLIERIVDVLFLLVLLIAVLLLNWDIISTLFHENKIDMNSKLSILHSPVFLTLIGVSLLTLVLIVSFWKRIKQHRLFSKLMSYAGKFTEGLKSLFRLRQPFIFVLLTAAIYGCYYLSTFFVFKAFGPTAALSPLVAFSVLALGSIGMVFPIPNGVGPFDWIALNTLLLYNISRPDGQLVTLVLHGSTTIFVILCGAVALAMLPIVNRNKTVV